MTITAGEPWGAPGRLASDGAVVTSDRELRALVEAARRAGRPLPEVGLLGGDLCRTVGGAGDERRLVDGTGSRLPVDVVRVELDGEPHWFVVHLVARLPLWHGRFAVAMNGDVLGQWLAGPRAHPNDGRIDITEGKLAWRDRLMARRRARSGDHLPHPDLRVSRVSTWEHEFARPVGVWLDGQRVGSAERIRCDVEPDSLIIVV